ncbi:ABC transporter substrate-binding protein [Rhizobium panacihumi]|uniref:ABC transporter substrate-binding protein n=1 Tax=Rhizobium panacihumi TaxID=2008450 RepID=UPI003D7B2786
MKTTRRSLLGFLGATALSPAIFSTTGGVPAAYAQDNDTLILAQTNDILTLDPANHGNNSTESALINIYDYLVNKEFVDGAMTFQPNLAKSWHSDDLIRWVFELHEGIVWHDGSAFTAEDVKFTIERGRKETGLNSASKFNAIETVNVLGPHRLEILTKGRDPLLLHSFVGNGAMILPKAAFEAAGNAEAFFAKPIGTGPYSFVQWQRGDRLTLKASGNWRGGKPHWSQVIVRGIPETSTRVAEALTGGAAVAVNIPPDDIERIKNGSDTNVASFDIARNFALHVRNEEGAGTRDLRVREAIDLAINREEIVQFILDGYATPTRGLFPPEIPGHNPELNSKNAFDPDRARALIEEAGAEGTEITLHSPSGRWAKDHETAETIVGYLQDIGLKAKLEVLEWSVFNSRLQADQLGDIYLWAMGSYTDASHLTDMNRLKRFNPHWQDEKFIALSRTLNDAPTEDERQAMLREAQRVMTDARVRIGILYPKAIYATSKRVTFPGRFDEMIPAEKVRRA